MTNQDGQLQHVVAFLSSDCGTFLCTGFRCLHYDSSCRVPEQIFLQSLVFWCVLLLGNMALFAGKFNVFNY